MKKLIKVLLLSLLLFMAACAFIYTLANAVRLQVVGEIIARVETEEKVVALTFDDGPTEHVSEILDVLADKQVKATFYLIGEQMKAQPELTKRIVNEGHELGNHSYTHKRMIFKSPSFIKNEIEATNQLIRNNGYQGEITFRPPYGKKLLLLPLYLQQQNIKTITWDVEPTKALGNDATKEQITDYVLRKSKPGSIILIHPWYGEENPSRAAVADIIDVLKAEGYSFVTVGELVQ